MDTAGIQLDRAVDRVTTWRPPVFKQFTRQYSFLATIFGHALAVAVAALTLDLVKDMLVTDDDVPDLPRGLRRFIEFLAAFVAGALAFFVMWFVFGLGYTPPHPE